MGQRSSGKSFEQQLAELDALEVSKGNTPLSAGMRGDEFNSAEVSSPGNFYNPLPTGAVGIPGVGAPTFEDLDEELEGDDPEEELEGDEPTEGAVGASGIGTKPSRKRRT